MTLAFPSRARSVTDSPLSTQQLRTLRTQRQFSAYRRLAVAILGVDVATLTCELRRARIESQYSQIAA